MSATGSTADDVNKAIAAQNAQVASGTIGAEPSTPDTKIAAQVLVKGQLSSPEEFGAIILRANPDGSTVRLRDVARIEIGGLSYQFQTRLDGKPTAGLSVLLAPTGNALATAGAVEKKMKELSKFFPANIAYEIPYNITPVVKASIHKVLMTLVEAVILVFIVMFLFLQNIRYTIIPTIVVPVALLGACATLMIAGYSINMLTMFGMVLAVGILVDDAIVVVENVERIMAEEGLPPKEATKKAMSQITGRHHRHHAGADRRVPADGVLPGIGRHHLPPVLRHHGGCDCVFGAAGAVADACAVCDAAQARCGRPWPRARRACSACSTARSIPAGIIIRAR